MSDERIMQELQVTAELLRRLLAVDGVTRCIECAFDLHQNCVGMMLDDRAGQIVACECDCRPACRV